MNKKRILIIAGTSVLALSVIAFSSYYFFFKNNKSRTDQENKDLTKSIDAIYENLNVFPELHQEEFYPYLRAEHGEIVMNDEFISHVINYVAKNMASLSGKLGYSFQKDQNEIVFHFQWTSDNGRQYNKSYKFIMSYN